MTADNPRAEAERIHEIIDRVYDEGLEDLTQLFWAISHENSSVDKIDDLSRQYLRAEGLLNDSNTIPEMVIYVMRMCFYEDDSKLWALAPLPLGCDGPQAGTEP